MSRNVVGSEYQFRTEYEKERQREHQEHVEWLASIAAETTQRKIDGVKRKYTYANFSRKDASSKNIMFKPVKYEGKKSISMAKSASKFTTRVSMMTN